jgi:hypothetical protein
VIVGFKGMLAKHDDWSSFDGGKLDNEAFRQLGITL